MGVAGIVEDDARSDAGVLRCSPESSAPELLTFGVLAGLNGSKVLLRVERWFFTSDFLMRLIILRLSYCLLGRCSSGAKHEQPKARKKIRATP